MGFSRQDYWSGLPFPPPGDLPKPGIKLVSPALAGGLFTGRTDAEIEAPILWPPDTMNSLIGKDPDAGKG